jgi:hypothetical protein
MILERINVASLWAGQAVLYRSAGMVAISRDGSFRSRSIGRLSFGGPYTEAMGNMGPFTNFLLLVGKVPADTTTCPQ